MASHVSYIPLNPNHCSSSSYLYFVPTSKPDHTLGCFLIDHEDYFVKLNRLLERLPLEEIAVKAECKKLGEELFLNCYARLKKGDPKCTDNSFTALDSMSSICANLGSEDKRRFVSLTWDGIGDRCCRWLTVRLEWEITRKLAEGCSFNYNPYRFGFID